MVTDEQVKNVRGAFCPSIEYAGALGFIVSGRRPQMGALSLEAGSLAVGRSKSGDSGARSSTDGGRVDLDRCVSQAGKGRDGEWMAGVETRRGV